MIDEGRRSRGRAIEIRLPRLQARYNRWFNQHLLAALTAERSRLSAQPGLEAAILRQLNHIHVMDWLWLERFASSCRAANRAPAGLRNLPSAPAGMDEVLFPDIDDWAGPRLALDRCLDTFVGGLGPEDLALKVRFITKVGDRRLARPLWSMLAHLFNHQSLHRGEVIGLLGLAGIDMGPTDILPLTARA